MFTILKMRYAPFFQTISILKKKSGNNFRYFVIEACYGKQLAAAGAKPTCLMNTLPCKLTFQAFR